MTINPYESPESDPNEPFEQEDALKCPECGQPMEPGYFLGKGVYWRKWGEKPYTSWGLPVSLPGTAAAFVGTNKIGGFRCADCELIVFRYGKHKIRPG